MKILFDQGTPVPLRRHLTTHEVMTVYECGWSQWQNGELLTVAEEAGFAVLITTDQNLRYQQNLSNRRIAILVLSTTSWPRIQRSVGAIISAVDGMVPGGYVVVTIGD